MRAHEMLVLAASALAWSIADRAEAAPLSGQVHVRVAKRGLFSAFAHDHDFEVTSWHGDAEVRGDDLAHASATLVLSADSLRDREPGLSAGDRAKVEAQTAGPEVLDAAREPEITYRATGATLEARPAGGGPVRGTIHGQLTLHGRTRPLDASFEAAREGGAWRVQGQVRFKQSDFGITPFSGAGGTVGVKDEVEVRFEVTVGSGGTAGPDARTQAE